MNLTNFKKIFFFLFEASIHVARAKSQEHASCTRLRML